MADPKQWQVLFNDFAEKRDTDFYLFSGSIYDHQADRMIAVVRSIPNRRKNGALALCTLGGNADCAYQIARIFKRRYAKFNLYVFGDCKSAGTLVAVGADEIVMSEFGQFGPLDVQLADKEELFGQTPALDVQQSLATTSKFAFDTFWDYFLELAKGGLSTKMATEVAKNLALGIVAPIAGQVEPLLLGRVDRSMKIASAYCDRLCLDFKGKKKLSGDYPSHSFVIDYEEAKTIFPSVREPDGQECLIEDMLRGWSRIPKPREDWIGLLSKEKEPPAKTNNEATTNGEEGTKPHSRDNSQARPTTSSPMGKSATHRTVRG